MLCVILYMLYMLYVIYAAYVAYVAYAAFVGHVIHVVYVISYIYMYVAYAALTVYDVHVIHVMHVTHAMPYMRYFCTSYMSYMLYRFSMFYTLHMLCYTSYIIFYALVYLTAINSCYNHHTTFLHCTIFDTMIRFDLIWCEGESYHDVLHLSVSQLVTISGCLGVTIQEAVSLTRVSRAPCWLIDLQSWDICSYWNFLPLIYLLKWGLVACVFLKLPVPQLWGDLREFGRLGCSLWEIAVELFASSGLMTRVKHVLPPNQTPNQSNNFQHPTLQRR